MADDWINAVVGALPQIPGFGALGVALAAFFRAGRGIGGVESQLAGHGRDIEALKSRLDGAEKLSADLAARLAEVPKRDEVRAMFTESREDARRMFDSLREDVRSLRHP